MVHKGRYRIKEQGASDTGLKYPNRLYVLYLHFYTHKSTLSPPVETLRIINSFFVEYYKPKVTLATQRSTSVHLFYITMMYSHLYLLYLRHLWILCWAQWSKNRRYRVKHKKMSPSDQYLWLKGSWEYNPVNCCYYLESYYRKISFGTHSFNIPLVNPNSIPRG